MTVLGSAIPPDYGSDDRVGLDLSISDGRRHVWFDGVIGADFYAEGLDVAQRLFAAYPPCRTTRRWETRRHTGERSASFVLPSYCWVRRGASVAVYVVIQAIGGLGAAVLLVDCICITWDSQ